jgi:hypothetical protein
MIGKCNFSFLFNFHSSFHVKIETFVSHVRFSVSFNAIN